MKRIRIGLFWRVYLLCLVVFTLPLVGAGLFVDSEIVSRYNEDSDRSRRWAAETLMLLRGQPSVLERRLRVFRTRQDISFTLYNAEGMRIAGEGASQLAAVPEQESVVWASAREHATLLVPGGYVVVDEPTFEVSLELPHLLLALLVVALLAWPVSHSLTRPLARLKKTVDLFGEGKLQSRSKSERADEIGELSRAFDQMAEQVAAAARLEKHLMAGISHELRTPLHRLRLGLELALEQDGALTKEELLAIEMDLADLEQLVAEVLAVARQTADNERTRLIQQVPVDVSGVALEAARRFERRHGRGRLTVDVDPHLVTTGDAPLLRRVVDNLLSNAARYSIDTTPIILRANLRHRTIQISVEDQGEGIADQEQERVFEAFERGRHAGESGGIGLGLTLARRVAAAHGGSIEIESALGQGSLFTLVLPRADADQTRSDT